MDADAAALAVHVVGRSSHAASSVDRSAVRAGANPFCLFVDKDWLGRTRY